MTRPKRVFTEESVANDITGLSVERYKRKGRKNVFNEADSEKIVVSMIEFEGKIYVATQKGVYIIKDDKLVRVEFVLNNGTS